MIFHRLFHGTNRNHKIASANQNFSKIGLNCLLRNVVNGGKLVGKRGRTSVIRVLCVGGRIRQISDRKSSSPVESDSFACKRKRKKSAMISSLQTRRRQQRRRRIRIGRIMNDLQYQLILASLLMLLGSASSIAHEAPTVPAALISDEHSSMVSGGGGARRRQDHVQQEQQQQQQHQSISQSQETKLCPLMMRHVFDGYAPIGKCGSCWVPGLRRKVLSAVRGMNEISVIAISCCLFVGKDFELCYCSPPII